MLVFLDIDGVMVPAGSWKRPEIMDDGFPVFSSQATKALQSLVSEDAAAVMLTTSHKSRYSIEEWKKIFQRRGIAIQNLDKLDDQGLYQTRKDELMNWFDLNGINEEFIIIDDDKSLNSLPANLKTHLVLTSSLVGLTMEQLDDFRHRA